MRALFDKQKLTSDINTYHKIQECQLKVNEHEYASLNDLITGLIMYDEILYLPITNGGFTDDYRTIWFEHYNSRIFKNIPISPIDIDPQYIDDSISFVQHTFPELAQIEVGPQYKMHQQSFGALEYFVISNYLGTTYFPSKNRREFLDKYFDFSNKIITPGEDIVNYIDKSVAEFYKELNDKIGKSYITFKLPLLLDYVYFLSEGKNDLLQTALQIRDTDELKHFRFWINEINESVNNGDWLGYKQCFDIVNEIIKRIEDKNKRKKFSFDVTLSWPPSITFPVNLKYIKSKKSKVGSMFIGNLATFGMTQRRVYSRNTDFNL